MSKSRVIARTLTLRWCCAALVLAAAILPAPAETIEGHVRPIDPNHVGACPFTHVVFDACTGFESFVWAHPDVELDVDPCEPMLLTGGWGWTLPQCPTFVVSDAEPATHSCTPQPGLIAERTSPTFIEWSWAPVPCVGSYDVLTFSDTIGTAPNMDEFYCALDNTESTAVGLVVGDPQPDILLALLVRGQQGSLATDHYGPASSGEFRRPPSDCAIDLTGSPAAPPRSGHSSTSTSNTRRISSAQE